MKQIYALFAAAAITLTAAAEETVVLNPGTQKLPDARMTVADARPQALTVAQKGTINWTLDAKTRLTERRKAEPGTQWIPLGKGKFRDDFLQMFDYYENNEIAEWEVEVYENADAPGYYAFENPWMAEANPQQVWASNDAVWIVDARNPDKVDVNMFYPGLESDPALEAFGTILVGGWPAFLELAGQSQQITDAMYGKLANGIIEVPAAVMYLENYNGGTGFMRQDAAFKLPGAAEHKVSLMLPSCAADNEAVLNVKYHYPEAHHYVYAAEGRFEGNADNYAAVVTMGQDVNLDSFKMKFAPGSKTRTTWSIFAVGADENKKVTCGAVTYFHIIPADGDKWTRIGQADVVEDIVTSQYTQLPSQTLKVDIEESKETPGLYRLVDPYATFEGYENDHEDDHIHYIYINAANKSQCYVEESPIGLDYGYGTMLISSYAYNAIANGGTPKAEHYGKYSAFTQTVTFPANTVVLGEMDSKNNLVWYKANKNGKFSVKIPTSGVDNIVAGEEVEGASRYFNLQGQPVGNPVAGQLLIVRNGSKVSKTVIR